jgi:hypothetical protein
MKGKSKMKNKITSALNTILDVFAKFRTVCHFLPLLSSVAWVIHTAFDPSRFVSDYILVPLLVIGWAAALIARPVKFITLAIGLATGGLTLGWTICPLFPLCIATAGIGLALGVSAALFLVAYAPAAITIYCFVKDKLNASSDEFDGSENLSEI